LAVTVQMTAGVGDGTDAEHIPVRPHLLAGLELLADPAHLVGVTINVPVHQDRAGNGVFHDPGRFSVVNLPGVELATRLSNLNQIAGGRFVPGADIDVAVVVDRRRDDDVPVRGFLLPVPEQIAVLRIHTGKTVVVQNDVLPHSANLRDDG